MNASRNEKATRRNAKLEHGRDQLEEQAEDQIEEDRDERLISAVGAIDPAGSRSGIRFDSAGPCDLLLGSLRRLTVQDVDARRRLKPPYGLFVRVGPIIETRAADF